MNLNFMQRVDYWLGRPLCGLATLIERLCPWTVRGFKDSESRKSAIFIELSEMGAAIVAAPAIRKAVEQYGKANTYFMIFEKNKESIEIQKILDPQNILAVDDKDFLSFLLSITKTILKMRRIGFAAAFDLELFSRCTALLTWVSGAHDRVGFSSGPDEGPYRGYLFSREVRYNHHLHMSHNFLALVESQITGNSTPYVKTNPGELPILQRLAINPAITQVVQRRLEDLIGKSTGKLILLNPDPGSLVLRGWPEEQWARLAGQLEQEFPDHDTVIVGLGQYSESAKSIVGTTQKKSVFDFCGKTDDLAELTSLMSVSSLLITCDSGPAHFASLVDLPTIVLFGPETPELYKPLGANVHVIYKGLSCSPCFSAYNHRQSSCKDNVCLKTISVEEVMGRVRKVMLGATR